MLRYEESNYRRSPGSLYGCSCLCKPGEQNHQQTITEKRAKEGCKEEGMQAHMPIFDVEQITDVKE